MLIAEDLHKSYGEVEVLKGVSLEVKNGEVISIVGASGAGKSTLLHILGTLELPDAGRLVIDDIETNRIDEKTLSKFRNLQIGFVFQFHHLLPEFSAIENVCMPAFIAKKSKSAAMKRATELLNFLSLGHRLHHKPNELSGGEQQRVAVARALINQPSLIMADEPSGNLDSDNSKELHQLFFDLRAEFNQSFIIVTHNRALAEMADRKLLMKDGIIEY